MSLARSPPKKNFVFCRENYCVVKSHILILEVSQGGNSHQSETNLIERPLKQHLPGARKGLASLQTVSYFSFFPSILTSKFASASVALMIDAKSASASPRAMVAWNIC